ncbi:hypothetical protein [Brevundimonas sp.]|uniref:hypothetical protein n=1 Tax=Brevundimonas sp. TaxID=1871086 RepID=UPI002601442E|nr:hypothetical protein [Brevundimonas sp.]
MDREFRIAIALTGLVAAWFVGLVLLIRYAVPMVLEARFTGAMFVAVVIGVAGVLGLAWAALLIYRWARRALGRQG